MQNVKRLQSCKDKLNKPFVAAIPIYENSIGRLCT